MAPSTPKARLSQVKGHLAAPEQPLATRFRPSLPPGLHPSFTPLNPLAFLLRAAQVRPDHVALVHPEKYLSWTYSQWAIRVAQLAYALKANGVKAGDRVMVIGPNVPFVSDSLQAVPAVQGILVAVNTRLQPADVAYLIQDSTPTLILVDAQFEELVQGTVVPVVVCFDSGRDDDPYEKLLAQGAAYDREHGSLGWSGLEFQKDELATFAISYTSGTTSKPKGVETSYRGTYLAAVANAMESGLTFDSVYLWILPKFHCLGWCYPYANTLAMSTQVCLRSVDYSEVWKGLLERGVTHYCGAPTVQLAIATHSMARKPTQAVRTTVAGAAPTATLIKQIEALGITIDHIYGMTETFGPMTKTFFLDSSSPTYYEDKARQGHAFRLADDVRITRLIPEGEEHKVVEGGLEEVKNDGTEIGEIVMRGNLVMKSYYNNPQATAKAFAGGYFHSGDLAVRRPDGTFAIQDRSKDIIISGGENISSLAIESALSSHPDVLECACIARPHEKWGERPHAYVVLKNSASWHGRHAAFEKELKGFSRGKLPGFATPEWVEVVDALEKTSTGKVQKHVLRAKLKELLSVGKNSTAPSALALSISPRSRLLSTRQQGTSYSTVHNLTCYSPHPASAQMLANTTKTKLTTPDGNFAVSVLIESPTTPGVYDPAPVYDPPANALPKPQTHQSYIASAESSLFKVHVDDLRIYQTTGLAASLYLDGTFIECFALDPVKGHKTCTFVGRRESQTAIRPFKFNKLALTDDDTSATTDEGIVKSMGTIVVKLCRIQVLGPSHQQATYAPPPSSAVLHERSKKAQLSHQTGLGAPVVTPAQTRTEATWYETNANPYVTFEIAYRSRTLLELLNIVPASEIAEPAPVAAAAPAAGPSTGNAGPTSSAKKRKATTVITIDSDSDDGKDVKPKIKAEKKIKGEKGAKKEKIVLEVD